MKIVIAVILIAFGTLALVYGDFSYTKESHDVKVGTIELSLKDKKTVHIPAWAGVGAIAAGTALLIFMRSKK